MTALPMNTKTPKADTREQGEARRVDKASQVQPKPIDLSRKAAQSSDATWKDRFPPPPPMRTYTAEEQTEQMAQQLIQMFGKPERS